MNKILISFIVMLGITSCAFTGSKKLLEKEQGKSFIYREDALSFFKGLKHSSYKNVFISEAKSQISQKNMDLSAKLFAMNYLDLATYEYYEKGDKVDGRYFFTKAQQAAKGAYFLPENLDDWSVARSDFEEFKKAREDLLNVVYKGGLKKDPIDVAMAQTYFDCWVERQSEYLDLSGAKVCKDEFSKSLAKASYSVNNDLSEGDMEGLKKSFETYSNVPYLNPNDIDEVYKVVKLIPEEVVIEESEVLSDEEIAIVVDDVIVSDEDEIIPEIVEEGINIDKISETEYSVYFDWNFKSPRECDKEKIKEVISYFEANGYNYILLKAYTDRSGSESFNEKLSRERASTIKDMLIEGGVSKDVITSFAFGEYNTPGADSVRNPEYRKVIIELVK